MSLLVYYTVITEQVTTERLTSGISGRGDLVGKLGGTWSGFVKELALDYNLRDMEPFEWYVHKCC